MFFPIELLDYSTGKNYNEGIIRAAVVLIGENEYEPENSIFTDPAGKESR